MCLSLKKAMLMMLVSATRENLAETTRWFPVIPLRCQREPQAFRQPALPGRCRFGHWSGMALPATIVRPLEGVPAVAAGG